MSKPFPQIVGKTITDAWIDAIDDSEYGIHIVFSDGSKLVVDPSVPEESNLDIWLTYGPG